MDKAVRGRGHFDDVRAFIGDLYGADLHAKRIDSLAGATLGAMTAASLAVAMIGHALAQARGLVTKHAVKQVDRLLSNNGIDVWDSFARWVPHQMAGCRAALVAMVRIDTACSRRAASAKPLTAAAVASMASGWRW